MRYSYVKPKNYIPVYGELYLCNHPLYDRCTLYKIGDRGLAVIQQRCEDKKTFWTEIDPWLQNELYLHSDFYQYFTDRSKRSADGLYPTVTIRQIMWALRMKPLKRQVWETAFDHCPL